MRTTLTRIYFIYMIDMKRRFGYYRYIFKTNITDAVMNKASQLRLGVMHRHVLLWLKDKKNLIQGKPRAKWNSASRERRRGKGRASFSHVYGWPGFRIPTQPTQPYMFTYHNTNEFTLFTRYSRIRCLRTHRKRYRWKRTSGRCLHVQRVLYIKLCEWLFLNMNECGRKKK